MKRSLIVAAVLACRVAAAQSPDTGDPGRFASGITPEGLREQEYILASKDLEVRVNGSDLPLSVVLSYARRDGAAALLYVQPGFPRGDPAALEEQIPYFAPPDTADQANCYLISGRVARAILGTTFPSARRGYPSRGIVKASVHLAFAKQVRCHQVANVGAVLPGTSRKGEAVLNMDMIGRGAPETLFVIGENPENRGLLNRLNEKYTHLELNWKYDDEPDTSDMGERSDQYPFAQHSVPVAFFFGGMHRDYHQPTDTPDKIDYPLYDRRAQLVFYTAWALANLP